MTTAITPSTRINLFAIGSPYKKKLLLDAKTPGRQTETVTA
jgi:hypothetical protein